MLLTSKAIAVIEIGNDGSFTPYNSQRRDGESIQEYRHRMENAVLAAATKIQLARLIGIPR